MLWTLLIWASGLKELQACFLLLMSVFCLSLWRALGQLWRSSFPSLGGTGSFVFLAILLVFLLGRWSCKNCCLLADYWCCYWFPSRLCCPSLANSELPWICFEWRCILMSFSFAAWWIGILLDTICLLALFMVFVIGGSLSYFYWHVTDDIIARFLAILCNWCCLLFCVTESPLLICS